MKNSNKEIYNFYKKKERHWLEAFCDCYNRRLELIRTISSFFGFLMQTVILLKVFGVIK